MPEWIQDSAASIAVVGGIRVVRLTVDDPSTIQDIKDIVTDLAPTASKVLPDIGHWAVGQKKGLPTITLILNDEELNQLLPLFEAHDGISKIRIQEVD